MLIQGMSSLIELAVDYALTLTIYSSMLLLWNMACLPYKLAIFPDDSTLGCLTIIPVCYYAIWYIYKIYVHIYLILLIAIPPLTHIAT